MSKLGFAEIQELIFSLDGKTEWFSAGGLVNQSPDLAKQIIFLNAVLENMVCLERGVPESLLLGNGDIELFHTPPENIDPEVCRSCGYNTLGTSKEGLILCIQLANGGVIV